MSEPRKQHYVPQVYLRNFGYGKEKSLHVHVLAVSSGKIYPDCVENTAAERHFYTLDNIEDKYVWENTYASSIEPLFGESLKCIRQRCENSLIRNRSLILNEEEKAMLSLSLIFQLLRGKHTREFEKQIFDERLPLVLDKAKELFSAWDKAETDIFDSFKVSDNLFKEISMRVAFREESILKYLRILMQHKFIFYRIIGNSEFITSDNPIVFMNANTHDVKPFTNGLANPITVLYFPISPKLLLGVYHPDFYLGVLNDRDCSLEIINSEKEKKFIQLHNMKQKEQCYEYVYAHQKESLEMLR